MKRTFRDKRKDAVLKIVRQLAKIWMLFDMKATYNFDESFNKRSKEPYLLLANHTFMFDVVHAPLYLRVSPFIVAQQNLLTKQPLKFLLEEIAHVIPKSKGAADVRAVRGLLTAVKKGYPILIFPEGHTTFNGETNYIEESTYKLIKKLKIDVVTIVVSGGYLSKPRWATSKRKNRRVTFDYKTLIKKEDLKALSLDEIDEKVKAALYHNAYDYQRTAMIKRPGKNKAEGLENILYICPNCETVGRIKTKGDHICCEACNTEGLLNDYGFIEGFKFDNTVDWDRWQRLYADKLKTETFESEGKIYIVDDESLKRKYIGEISIKYNNNAFHVNGALNKVFEFDKVKNPTATLRRNFNINYEGVHYLIKIEQYVSSFLRVVQTKY